MDYTIFYKYGLFMCGHLAGFKTSAMSILTSTITLPGRILLTISSVTTTGVRPPAATKRPTATSQVFNCLASIFGSITDVHMRYANIILQPF